MPGGGESTPKPSYWGERETKEWRRKLKEKKEKVETERRERIEWMVREMQMRGQLGGPGRFPSPPENWPGWKTETRTPSHCWKGRLDRYWGRCYGLARIVGCSRGKAL